jgi:RNA recognition motif-containing protein
LVRIVKLCSKFCIYWIFILLIIFFRFAFVTFENESDCADALKAHTQIGGEKVNVSYAFAKADTEQKPTTTDSNKKPATSTENTNKKQQTKAGSC